MSTAIISASVLQDALEPPGVLVDKCELQLNEQELAIQAVNDKGTSMVHLSVEATAFESYDTDDEVITVDLSLLKDIASIADSGDLIHLELSEKTQELTVSTDQLAYTLPPADSGPIYDVPDIPELDLPGKVFANGAQLDCAINSVDIVSDYARLWIDEDKETFVIEIQDTAGDVKFELTREKLNDLTVGTADTLLSLDLLKDINKAIPNNAEILIELGEDTLTKFHYDFAEGLGHVTFILAPRIQPD